MQARSLVSWAMETQTRTETANAGQNRVWVVTAPSAYRMCHTCFLGRGATKAAALSDAFGPREAWGNATRKSMRIADVYECDKADADEMEFNSES